MILLKKETWGEKRAYACLGVAITVRWIPLRFWQLFWRFLYHRRWSLFSLFAVGIVMIDKTLRGRFTWNADATVAKFIVLWNSDVSVCYFCVAIAMLYSHILSKYLHFSSAYIHILKRQYGSNWNNICFADIKSSVRIWTFLNLLYL